MARKKVWKEELFKFALLNKEIKLSEIIKFLPNDFKQSDLNEVLIDFEIHGIRVIHDIVYKKTEISFSFSSTKDISKNYFKDLSRLSLLSKEEEIFYSKKIEEGYNQIIKEIFRSTNMIDLLVEDCSSVEKKERNYEHFIRIGDIRMDRKNSWNERLKFLRKLSNIKKLNEKLKDELSKIEDLFYKEGIKVHIFNP